MRPDVMWDISKKTADLCIELLENEFDEREIEVSWPKWWKGVTSMYAGELILNDEFDNFDKSFCKFGFDGSVDQL
eukprot:UN32658